MKPKQYNVALMIHPTPYQDYDIVAVGDLKLLKLYKKIIGGDLILKSKYGGIPILVIDTVDEIKDTLKILEIIISKCLKHLKEMK